MKHVSIKLNLLQRKDTPNFNAHVEYNRAINLADKQSTPVKEHLGSYTQSPLIKICIVAPLFVSQGIFLI